MYSGCIVWCVRCSEMCVSCVVVIEGLNMHANEVPWNINHNKKLPHIQCATHILVGPGGLVGSVVDGHRGGKRGSGGGWW
mgnify:CR=1 FL=1